MARSLFQKPRGTGFQGRYRAFEDDGDLRPRRYDADFEQRHVQHRSFFSRLPLIVKIIVLMFAATVGLIVGAILWLAIGGLTMMD
jgi:hypothetical protein